MRLIDADEARKNLDVYLKKIHNHSINVVSKYGKEMFEVTENAIRGCIDIVNLIPTANEWIPCSEQLPKESERDFIVSVAKKYRWLGYSVIMIRESSVLINGYKDGFYDAWKKAPKPYEVKEE